MSLSFFAHEAEIFFIIFYDLWWCLWWCWSWCHNIYIRKIKIMMTKMIMVKMNIAMKIMIMMMTKNLYIGNMKNSWCSFLPPKARYVGGSWSAVVIGNDDDYHLDNYDDFVTTIITIYMMIMAWSGWWKQSGRWWWLFTFEKEGLGCHHPRALQTGTCKYHNYIS